MAYDGTSLYGDIICDDYYDTQNNLMNPPSDVGFFFYKIIGGVFDRMSEICSNFLNDCDVLTCVLVNREYGARVSDFKSKSGDTDYVVTTDYESFDHYKYDKSSDTFVFVETTDNAFITRTKLDTRWGKEYDLPRPLLYEGQKADYLFVDNGITASHNDNWRYPQYITRDDEGTTILNTGTEIVFEAVTLNNTTLPFTNENFIVEFEIVENPSSTNRFRFDGQTICTGGTYAQQDIGFSRNETGKFRFVYNKANNTITKYKNGTYVSTYNHQFCGKMGLLFRLEPGESIKYKDFKVYTGEDKERYLTDEEYRVYLYCNMCRLLTMEDIRRVFEHCFNTENNSISISEVPSNIFTLTDKVRNNQNLAGTTDYLRDAGDTHLVNKYSVNVNSFTEIRIPSQGWDSEFLELIKESASLKGNVLIREVSA